MAAAVSAAVISECSLSGQSWTAVSDGSVLGNILPTASCVLTLTSLIPTQFVLVTYPAASAMPHHITQIFGAHGDKLTLVDLILDRKSVV